MIDDSLSTPSHYNMICLVHVGCVLTLLANILFGSYIKDSHSTMSSGSIGAIGQVITTAFSEMGHPPTISDLRLNIVNDFLHL